MKPWQQKGSEKWLRNSKERTKRSTKSILRRLGPTGELLADICTALQCSRCMIDRTDTPSAKALYLIDATLTSFFL